VCGHDGLVFITLDVCKCVCERQRACVIERECVCGYDGFFVLHSMCVCVRERERVCVREFVSVCV